MRCPTSALGRSHRAPSMPSADCEYNHLRPRYDSILHDRCCEVLKAVGIHHRSGLLGTRILSWFHGEASFRIIPNMCATAMGPTKIQSVGLDISSNVEARGELCYHQSLQPQSTQPVWNTPFIGLFHIVRLFRASFSLSQVFRESICYIGTPGAPSHLDSFP